MPTRSLAEFDIKGQIGSGTVGRIYEAVDTKSGRSIALKVLNDLVSQDKLVRQRFYREIQVLQRLQHPNIIAYLEDGRDKNASGESLFYTMEIVRGTALSDAIAQHGKLDWSVAVECAWQLCAALQHAHNHNVIHRDLKPSNVFLSRQGFLKLADFGIALDVGAADITDQGMTVGSYLYMPPEQIRGERTISNQSDLYALGCLLYEMLVGTPPFQGTNFAEIFNQHLESPVPSIRESSPDCPEKLEELVSHLLKKQAFERPDTAREVQGRLGEVLIDNGAGDVLESLKRAQEDGTEAIRTIAARGNLGRRSQNEVIQRLIWLCIGGAIVAAVLAILAIVNG